MLLAQSKIEKECVCSAPNCFVTYSGPPARGIGSECDTLSIWWELSVNFDSVVGAPLPHPQSLAREITANSILVGGGHLARRYSA